MLPLLCVFFLISGMIELNCNNKLKIKLVHKASGQQLFRLQFKLLDFMKHNREQPADSCLFSLLWSKWNLTSVCLTVLYIKRSSDKQIIMKSNLPALCLSVYLQFIFSLQGFPTYFPLSHPPFPRYSPPLPLHRFIKLMKE